MQQTFPSSSQLKEQTIAAALGKRSFQDIDWRSLMLQGVLIKLCVRRCRFTTKLELSDLGLTVADDRVREALAKTLKLGEKRLLPETYMTQLERVESGARRALKNRSFQTELGAFLPRGTYDAWKQETEAYRLRYFALRDEILAKHRELVTEVLGTYEIVARDTYQRLRETRPDVLRDPEALFVSNYCNRIASLIPSPQRIETSFGFEFSLRDSKKEANTLEDSQDDPALMTTRSDVRLEEVRSLAAEQDWQESALDRDLRAQAQQQKRAVVDSFLSALIGQTRSLVYEAATDVLAVLQRQQQGTFSGRSVGKSFAGLRTMLKQLEALNFYGDREMETMMAEVQSVLDLEPARRERSLADMQQKFRDIAIVTRKTLLDLGEEPREAREVGIQDVPTEGSVRTARLQLQLEMPSLAQPAVRSTRLSAQVLTLPWEESESPERGQRLALVP